MPSSPAGGRDNPHSPGVETGDGSARDSAGSSAPVGLGLVLAAVVVAVSPLPASFAASAEPRFVLPTPGPLGGLWDALVLAVPVGERGLRGELGALALVLATAAAAGLLALRLYRGPGRTAAAAATVPVCAALLLAWLRGPTVDAAATLGGTLLISLGLARWVGARVHGRVGVGAWVVGLIGVVAGLGLWFGTGLFGHVLADSSELRAQLDLIAPARWTGPALLDLGLALLVLLVFPLRWRGGAALLAITAGALVLGDRSGPLVPAPLLLVLLAVAACGWIWLAGSVPARRWIADVAAAAATLALLGLTAGVVVRAAESVAPRRPVDSLLALHQRGLIAPGDVLLAHEPWLAAAFAAAQRDEGVRPDVLLYAAAQVDAASLSGRLAAWSRAGRRVLSDSFNYAGRWQAAWTLDSGPLFWFIGTASAAERDFTDLHAHSPALVDPVLGPDERARWERMHVERARHRRALARHDEALLALPLDDETMAALAQRLHLAKLSRLSAAEGSELTAGAWSAAPAPASALAEAGDLLLALGDGAAGSLRLEEAAERGVAGAFGALARWQLRAGEEEAARATLAVVAAAPVLRPQLLEVCRWLLARARGRQAAELLKGLTPAPEHAAAELGTRLAVLRGVAGP